MVKRDVILDITRSLSILWIVGYWHLSNYVWDAFYQEYIWDSAHGKYITICVLSSFTFLSGYFLKKYDIKTKSDTINFYKKRMRRFWIPFFISTFTLHIASILVHHPWFTGHLQFVATILGLSIFTPPSPGTVWYISMLMTFYMITPLILYIKDLKMKILVSVVLIVAMAISINIWDLNIRTIYYLPVYLCSLFFPSEWVIKIKNNPLPILLLSLAMLYPAIYLFNARWYAVLTSLIFGPICLIAISTFLSKVRVVCKLSEIVSYSSMNMYLFHRHVFMAFVAILAFGGMGSFSQMKTSVWPVLFVAFPIVIVISYYLQKVYDRSCRYLGW